MCFYRFRRCPFGTRLRSNLATPWALILMGFGCFGRWPTTASCNGVSFPSYSFFSSPSIRPPTIPEMCLDVFLQVSKVPFRHPSAVEFGHPLGAFSAGGPRRPLATVSPFQAIASAVVHPYVRPPFRRCAWMCFYGFRRCPFGTRLRSNLATPWALILMGFGCFGRWPTTASCNGVSFPTYSFFSSPSIRPPTIPEMCLDVFLRVSKVPFRHPSAVEFGHPLGSYPDGVWLFRHVAHACLLQRCHLSKLASSATSMLLLCFFTGFHGAIWTPCLGTTLARRGLGEGFGPCVAGVSIFFGHGHFATHVVVGQVFPLGILCLLCIFPEALAD